MDLLLHILPTVPLNCVANLPTDAMCPDLSVGVLGQLPCTPVKSCDDDGLFLLVEHVRRHPQHTSRRGQELNVHAEWQCGELCCNLELVPASAVLLKSSVTSTNLPATCRTYLQQSRVLRPLTASNCCYWGHGRAQKWYFSVSSTKKKWYVCSFLCFANSSAIIAFVATEQLCRLATRTNTLAASDMLLCYVQVALLLWFPGPSIVSVVFRLVRSWLFCSNGLWLRLFVARFWLAEVG